MDPYARSGPAFNSNPYDQNNYQQSTDFGFGFDFPSNSQYAPYGGAPSSSSSSSNAGGGHSLFTPGVMHDNLSADPFASSSDDPYADEPPLLEELGINFDQIRQKTLAVINPLRQTDATILHDSDLAGPFVFCLAFGCCLLLSGKVSFGNIYGIGVMGCLAMYVLLNLMAPPQVSLSISCTASVLGYCLLPMVLLSAVGIVISLKITLFSQILTLVTVSWCALTASKLFVTACSMQNQYALVLFPCALLYGVFALLTVF